MGLDNLTNGLVATIKANPLSSAIGATGVVAGAGLGAVAVTRAVKRRKSKRNKTRTTRKRTSRVKRSKRKSTKRKRHHTTSKRIKHTKNGQPYIILSNGRAKFISKTGAKRRRKVKGGYY